MRMLARVEGMPLEVARRRACPGARGGPSASGSTASTATSALNAGFLVGHSAIRRVVMGDGVPRAATPSEASSPAMAPSCARGAGGRRAGLLLVQRHRRHHDARRRTGAVTLRVATTSCFALCRAVRDAPGHDARVHPAGAQRLTEAERS